MSSIKFYLVLCVLAGVNGRNHSHHGAGDKRVVGGDLTLIYKYPYQVALGAKISPLFYFNFRCGGSIISRQHILTAGHCVDDDNDFYIRSGTSQIIFGLLAKDIKVVDKYIHPQYKIVETVAYNDIAVLKLNEAINFNSFANKIDLPAPNSEPINSNAVVTGWGLTSSSSLGPSAWLMKAEVPVITNQKCVEVRTNLGFTLPIEDTNLCTLNDGRPKTVCSGDSGGPLVQNGKVIGVVSFGPNYCEREGTPSVYARVSKFVDWINEKLQN